MSALHASCAVMARLFGSAVLVVDRQGRVTEFAGVDNVQVGDCVLPAEVVERFARSTSATPAMVEIDGRKCRAHGMRADEPGTQVIVRLERPDSSRFVALNEQIEMLRRRQTEIRDALSRARTAEAETRVTVAELRASNEQLEHYAALVAHDIRAPIRTAKMLAEAAMTAVATDESPEVVADLGDRLLDTLGRLDTIVVRLLEYSSLGDHAPQIEELTCAGIVDDVQRDLKVTLAEAGIRPEVRASGVVRADRTLLVVAARELVKNATKYRSHERTPRIEIEFIGGAGGAELVVSDNGIGIPVESRDRAFEMFSRLNAGGPAGLGFGLTYCRRIAEIMGGSLELDTGLDDLGLSARFSLPGDETRHGLEGELGRGGRLCETGPWPRTTSSSATAR